MLNIANFKLCLSKSRGLSQNPVHTVMLVQIGSSLSSYISPKDGTKDEHFINSSEQEILSRKYYANVVNVPETKCNKPFGDNLNNYYKGA